MRKFELMLQPKYSLPRADFASTTQNVLHDVQQPHRPGAISRVRRTISAEEYQIVSCMAKVRRVSKIAFEFSGYRVNV